MVLDTQQKRFFEEFGYLKYDRQVLSNEELEAIRKRSEDIARGTLDHVPSQYIQLESKFNESSVSTVDRLDQVRKMVSLSYFDDVFESTARKSEIVDVIDDLIGPNIKLYTDQLMMKPRFHGTVTDWHQDNPAWPQFLQPNTVSCWVALDDATAENGCMTVIPGSHKWGAINKDRIRSFQASELVQDPVSVEVKAGFCMFHDGLNLHRTGANKTANRRRGLALHYIKSEAMYLAPDDEDENDRLYREKLKPKGEFRHLLIRGKEFDGCV